MKNNASIKKFGILLSGCGFLDGAEIHEVVLTLLALDRAGAEAQCFAPDILQHHEVNHLTGKVSTSESRNVLVESARIARGAIADTYSSIIPYQPRTSATSLRPKRKTSLSRRMVRS